MTYRVVVRRISHYEPSVGGYGHHTPHLTPPGGNSADGTEDDSDTPHYEELFEEIFSRSFIRLFTVRLGVDNERF